MPSLLTFLGSSLNSIELYSKIYNNLSFKQFNENISSNTSSEVITQLFRNILLVNLDKYFNEIEHNSEFNIVFSSSNDNLSKLEKSKLYIGKVASYFYDKYMEDLKDIIFIEKKNIIEYLIVSLNDIENLDKINNARDVYTLLLNICATKLTLLFQTYFFQEIFSDINEDETLTFIFGLMSDFNKIFNYNSKNINKNLLESYNDQNLSEDKKNSRKRDFDGNKNDDNNKKPKK